MTAKPRLVLLGAGHLHLPLLAPPGRLARALDLTLVAPGPFHYSGLAPAVLAGQHPPEAGRVDVAALVARAGGRFVEDLAARVEPAARRVHLAGGGALPYELLCIDIGSTTPAGRVPGLERHGLPVKPVSNLARLHALLEARASGTPGGALRLTVVGGGASGCEVAATLARASSRAGLAAEIALLHSGERLAPRFPAGVGRRLRAHLLAAGVRVRLGSRVREARAGHVVLEDGARVPHDLLVDATGLRPPTLLAESGLPVDGEGALRVDRHLRSVGDPRVLGGGDCVAFEGRRLPRIGVHAVKQARVLRHNLPAMVEGGALRAYRPRKRSLLILNLGDGTAMAVWGGLWWQGRGAYLLKDRIDRRFLRRFA